MKQILINHVDSIILTKKETGELVEHESGNKMIAVISNDEIILDNDYEIKIVPADK